MMNLDSHKILVGITLDLCDSHEVLNRAISVLAKPNDRVIVVHVLVGEDSKRHSMKRKKQVQIRQAKAHVITVLGEFATICQSKKVNLEARVVFGSSVARGLVNEAKSLSADYLVLRRSRNHSYRTSHEIAKCSLELSPASCTVVLVGKTAKAMEQKDVSDSDSSVSEETQQLNSVWSESPKSSYTVSEAKDQNTSPRTVLDVIEGDSNSSGDDTHSVSDSTVSSSSAAAAISPQSRAIVKKPMSPCKLFTTLFGLPLRRRRLNNVPEKQKPDPLIQCYCYEQLAKATKDFNSDNIVGVGGYSEVYRGELPDGKFIAVKRLAKDNNDLNKEKEFLTELGIIGHVSHQNTASLLGCCVENGLYLIFKFSENGTLASALHEEGSNVLEWPIRYKIAVGVARGLHYLHKCCKHRIIHRDIKASNVLLGPDYEPQITDFGLAKWLPNKWTHHAVIPIEGTFGYLAPEYFMHGIVDEKIDVYAFGILLLEIITGRRPVDSSQQNLLLWAKPLMESGNTTEIADPKLEGEYDENQMHGLLSTACFCVRQSPSWRPSMSEVLEIITNGHESEIARSWRMPKFTPDEVDDYSMILGYDVPIETDLEEDLS